MSSSSGTSSSKFKFLRDSFAPILNSMRGGANAIQPGEGTNVPLGSQLIETFVIVVVFSLSMQLLETTFGQLKNYNQMAVDVYPLTYNSYQRFVQDPSSCFPILEPSKDERNGAEYSYSSFINVSSDNFTGEQNVFRHVFHKGSPSIYPLMAPGVFFKADTNVLRVYQNSTLDWNRFVDIPNIPLNKWFHLVVMLKGNALDVYINGNLANRYKFTDVPKLNFSDFHLLSGSTVGISERGSCSVASTEEGGVAVTAKIDQVNTFTDQGVSTGTDKLRVVGGMRGYVSRVKYFAYALNYVQIDKLLKEGPNKKLYSKKKDAMDNNSSMDMSWNSSTPNSMTMGQNLPFYQTDDWWTSKDHQGIGPQ